MTMTNDDLDLRYLIYKTLIPCFIFTDDAIFVFYCQCFLFH